MQYDFDTQIPRRGTNSYKWDSASAHTELPLWVADMDFKAAPPIIDALKRRVEHGIFGYVTVPATYYQSVIGWFERRHGWRMEREWIIYTTGVVPAISAIIKGLTTRGDKVLVQSPVYNCFYSSIRNNGCEIESNDLVREGNTYKIDFDDLERKVSDPRVKLMLLCNPHNPTGRVWTKEELRRIGETCFKHGVKVVSDEIHCEFVYEGHEYTPFASLGRDFLEQSVTCTSPSKTFNIAGLQIANITVYDAELRADIDRAINDNEVCDVNPFGVEALQAAYNEGEAWLTSLLDYLHGNYMHLCEYFAEKLPQFPVTTMEGTYLVWVDCGVLDKKSAQITDDLIAQTGVQLSPGEIYGPNGDRYVRINIACPRSRLDEALTRIARRWQEQLRENS